MTALRSQAALALTAVGLAAAALAPAGAAAQASARPNIVFVMTDDQTRGVAARDEQGARRSWSTRARTSRSSIATLPAVLPVARHLPDGPVPPQPRRDPQRRRRSAATPVWTTPTRCRFGCRAPATGRSTSAATSTATAPRTPTSREIPPGWTDWYSTLDPSTFNFTRWRMNENGRIIEKPGPDSPGEYQTDYLGRRATELIQRAAPVLAAVLPLAHLPGAPQRRCPLDPDDPPTCARRRPRRATATRSPPPRCRGRRASTRPDVLDKPQITADRRRLTLADVAAIQENYQQELESLLSVDDAIGQRARTRSVAPASWRTRCSSTRPTTASSTASTGSRAREGPALLARRQRAAGHARARRAARQDACASSWPMWTWRPRSSRRPTPRPGGFRTGARCSVMRDQTLRARAASSCTRTAAGVNSVPPVPGAAQRPLPVRPPRHHRRDGVVRPAQGPVRAHQPATTATRTPGSSGCSRAGCACCSAAPAAPARCRAPPCGWRCARYDPSSSGRSAARARARPASPATSGWR